METLCRRSRRIDKTLRVRHLNGQLEGADPLKIKDARVGNGQLSRHGVNGQRAVLVAIDDGVRKLIRGVGIGSSYVPDN